MKKVYCKNCKYNGGAFLNFGEEWKWCKMKNEYTGSEMDEYSTLKIERNKDGECIYYKRKW